MYIAAHEMKQHGSGGSTSDLTLLTLLPEIYPVLLAAFHTNYFFVTTVVGRDETNTFDVTEYVEVNRSLPYARHMLLLAATCKTLRTLVSSIVGDILRRIKADMCSSGCGRISDAYCRTCRMTPVCYVCDHWECDTLMQLIRCRACIKEHGCPNCDYFPYECAVCGLEDRVAARNESDGGALLIVCDTCTQAICTTCHASGTSFVRCTGCLGLNCSGCRVTNMLADCATCGDLYCAECRLIMHGGRVGHGNVRHYDCHHCRLK